MANQSNKSPFGVGHDGRPMGVPNAPGTHSPARQSDAFKGRAVPGNIARDGAPKFHHDVPVHGAMNAKSRRTGEHFDGVGGDGISRYDANPGTNPTLGPPAGKRLSPVRIAPTMRSRTSPGLTNDLHVQLGRAILDEARSASSVDDRLYGVGSLPSSTDED